MVQTPRGRCGVPRSLGAWCADIRVVAGRLQRDATCVLPLYSALGTILWTAALAYAGVALQANFTAVGDYLDVATNALLVVGGIVLVKRYIRCWKVNGG